ncbi:hypothetical protein ACOMHN_017919 [Nucella lapillus]
MDQLWKRVWYGVSRKKHGPRHYAVASRTRSAPVPGSYAPQGRYVLGTRHYSFHGHHMAVSISQRPKMLLDVDCSNLLTGGSNQYENFSSTCWLEDHLHHFGEPVSLSAQASTSSIYWNLEEVQESGPDLEDAPGHSSEDAMDESSPARRAAEEEEEEEEEEDVSESVEAVASTQDIGAGSSVPVRARTVVGDDHNTRQRRRHRRLRRTYAVSDPPPYITDPPPSYEEAVAGNSVVLDCGNSDFMW